MPLHPVVRPIPSMLVLAALVFVAPPRPSASAGERTAAETDLDALMKQVLTRRDDNWKKLQQYVLDEREQIELRGPSHAPVWGEQREYTWYIRDGFFVRSPVTFNGVAISESERRKYEDEYLRRSEERDRRAPGGQTATEPPTDVDSFIRQTRQPRFISSAYFLRFRFEEGRYAFVGRELVDGRDVLRIEYYPTRMFSGTDRRRSRRGASEEDRARDLEFQRLMNKVALITLWVEPNVHQIVKYTFSNIALDFLPAQWLARVNDVKASMTMSQPFTGVWLPRDLELSADLTIAIGQFDFRYSLIYRDYRRADVTTKVTVPGAR